MLEWAVWHATQYIRQAASLLEMSGINPPQLIPKQEMQGLPVTYVVWDEG